MLTIMSDNIWYHYTDRAFQEDNRTYMDSNLKPDGLWLSCNDDWLVWCLREGFHTDESSYRYEVTIDGNFLKIETLEQYSDFVKRYGLNLGYLSRINWSKVQEDYDGLIVLNYQSIKDRLEPLYINTWFYALDVCCACVWRGYKVQDA
jgi:hypothetical protein